ncbi:MAG: hypothetical protein Q8S14_01105 [Algoriphagus sp.]|uniref:hypothetical protein n=1 Tax=Algoriphagus sp. TaxID=1872435 RepID=UPI0027305FED|nr:hypothetical protein [Algoriphagus sp.]MDP2043433.1 hypothetical protein [Algoriphagus sp.]MDP3470441.1 hypothetical protein [Algoriphagus sp.]
MNREIFSNISKIIERDSKATTYKFALLRGTIDLIQENSPFLEFKDDRVHIHLIPRYSGDVEDPRGGVRGVLPERRLY